MAENDTNTTQLLGPEAGDGSDDVERGRPKEPWKGEFVKSVVYAGLDSIVTCFSLISSISAGHLSSVDVLVLGFASLMTDGISMGFEDFVSSITERDMAVKERAVTKWDVDNRSRLQLKELLHKYQMLGICAKDASTVKPPDEEYKPWKNGARNVCCLHLLREHAPALLHNPHPFHRH